MKKIVVGTLGALLLTALVGCAGSDVAPVLTKRGISADDRKFQAENTHSLGMSAQLIDIYKEGYVAEGMTESMVHDVWGEPNRKGNEGKVWEYTNKKGELITLVQYDSTKAIRGEEHMIVTDIKGDRYGGAGAPKR